MISGTVSRVLTKIFPTLIVCLWFPFYVCCHAQVCDEYFSLYKKYANQNAGQRLLLFLKVKDENKKKILGCLNIYFFVRKTNQGLKLTLKNIKYSHFYQLITIYLVRLLYKVFKNGLVILNIFCP